jgi:hypothetical protein
VSVLGRELLRRMSDIVAWLHSPLLLFKGMQDTKWPYTGWRNWHGVVGAVGAASVVKWGWRVYCDGRSGRTLEMATLRQEAKQARSYMYGKRRNELSRIYKYFY